MIIVNLGDSWAIMSEKKCEIVWDLSKDHKPEETSEKNRILKEGGKVM